jgi:regulator of nonsense transcripts 2
MEGVEQFNEDEDEEVVLFNRNVEPEVEDEEFNREFARIMSESLESRKATSKTTFDVNPPTVRTRTQSTNSDIIPDPQRVQFAVLSRRNKQVP